MKRVASFVLLGLASDASAASTDAGTASSTTGADPGEIVLITIDTGEFVFDARAVGAAWTRS